LAHGTCGLGVGQHNYWLAISENSIEVVCVSWLVWIIKRHGDHAGVNRAEEAENVLRAVVSQDRCTITQGGDLLQTACYSLDTSIDLVSGVLNQLAIAVFGEVPEMHAWFIPAAFSDVSLVHELTHGCQS